MKHFKKLVICIMICLSAILLNFEPKKSNNEASAEVLNDNAFEYISLVQSDQIINKSKLKTLKENGTNYTYVIANKPVTITFKPFDYNYRISNDTISDNYNITTHILEIEKDADGEYPTTFTINGRTLHYTITASNNINIYHGDPKKTPLIVSSSNSDLIKYNLNGEIREIYYTTSYTTEELGFVDAEGNPSNTCDFVFTRGTQYHIRFQKPIINFNHLSEPVVMFDTHTTQENGDPYPPEKSIAPDQVFNQLDITFLKNDYTEGNPLYFNINFNGFVYEYTLFSKEIDGKNLLFVNYINESTSGKHPYNNSEFLASSTSLDEPQEVLAKENGIDNQFTMILNQPGRYSIEIYDTTHILKMVDANYYSTSFFIREESEKTSQFQNIYVVAQTIKDNGTPIEYIVRDSTVNYSTRITIKNLGDFGTDDQGHPITLADTIDKIVVRKTDFGIDHVETINTVYTVEEISKKLQNNDFILDFHEDAYYQVLVYPNKTKDTSLEPIHYIFTIIKYAKTTFTFNGKPYDANTPYKTDNRSFENPIESDIKFKVKFTTIDESQKHLFKTYINKFTVKLGVKKVAIETYKPTPKSDDEKIPAGVYLKVYGVGDLTVYVTYNGQTEVLQLNSEKGNNTIDRTAYGTYTIRIVDSMGTETTATFKHSKKLNTSALVLIVLLLIIGSVITLFIVKARTRISTR